jgi:hypothetical protein
MGYIWELIVTVVLVKWWGGESLIGVGFREEGRTRISDRG